MDQRTKKKVAFFISDSGERDRQRLYEFQAHALKNYDQHYFILAGNKHFRSFLESEGIPFSYLDYSPESFVQIIRSAINLSRHLKGYDIVHTHYHDANFLGLLSAWFARVPLRIYTRHHNSYYHDHGHHKSILVNRLFNWLSSSIIAPSASVKHTLLIKEGVPDSKVKVVYHPFVFEKVSKKDLRQSLNIPDESIVIGSIATFQPLKGLNYLIEAFAQVRKQFPNSVLVMANAHGSHLKEYQDLVNKKIGEDHVRYILYENNVASLYALFDVFVHVPISASSESFGQVFVEALAYGVPSVFTSSGVLPEIGKNNFNCQVVPFCDSSSIGRAVITYLNDRELCNEIIKNGKETASSMFGIESFSAKLDVLYNRKLH